jgi:hypothetical protein
MQKVDRRHAESVGKGDAQPAPSEGPPGKRTLVEQSHGVQMKRGEAGASPDHGAIGEAAAAGVSGSGAPLPHIDRIQASFGAAQPLTGVRAHVGGDAATACDTIGATAYATGRDVAFRAQPDLHTAAHEAAHVVQQASGVRLMGGVGQSGDVHEQHADAVADRVVRGESAVDLLAGYGNAQPASAATPAVQRKVKPEDVSSEMIGKTFELSEAFTAGSTVLKAGDQVKAVAWDNAKATVSVDFTPSGGGAVVRLEVPKKLLRPTHATTPGMNAYSAGVNGQAAAVDAAEDKLADWVAKEAEYKKAGTTKLWTEEKARLEEVVKKKTEVLNRKLIQETMFNRFDAVIKREVDAANAAAGFKGEDALDPNLMKSMLFQESQLGTSGEHLEVPPSHDVKSRFNLGQVIDSSALALLTMLEKEQAAIVTTFKLETIRTDLATAQKRHAELKKKATRSAAENTELADLETKSEQNWEAFIWSYRAAGSAVGFSEAVRHFFTTVPAGTPEKHLDYEFWIHMAVLWLFEKHKKGMSWPATIRAYNGSGKRADHYRDAVTKRATSAASAAKKGSEFIPDNI